MSAARDQALTGSNPTKEDVKRALFAVCEHYAGAPFRKNSESSTAETRYYICPECNNRTFMATVPNDTRRLAEGKAGCFNKSCTVRSKADALDVIVVLEGYAGPGRFAASLARGAEILRISSVPRSNTPHSKALTNAAREPEVSSEAQPRLSFRMDGESTEIASRDTVATKPSPACKTSEGDPTSPGYHQPPLDLSRTEDTTEIEVDGTDNGLDDALDARHLVYQTLLDACPPEDDLFRYFSGLGVSAELVRHEDFGLFRSGTGTRIVAALAKSFGTDLLADVPGFVHPTGAVLSLELEGADRALVPYRDTQRRILAFEVFDLTSLRNTDHDATDLVGPAQPSHRLLGGGRTGRDNRVLGGAHHLWSAGNPAALQLVTDDIVQALRCASVGVRAGAIRSPTAHEPGSVLGSGGVLPEMRGVSYEGRKVLYVPGHRDPERSRTAGASAAERIIGCADGLPLLLERHPYSSDGVGDYLAAAEHTEHAFERLFEQHRVRRIHPRTPNEKDGTTADEGPPPLSERQKAEIRRSHLAQFYRHMVRRPRKPGPNGPLARRAPRRAALWSIVGFFVLWPFLALALPTYFGVAGSAASGALSFYQSTYQEAHAPPPSPRDPNSALGIPGAGDASSAPSQPTGAPGPSGPIDLVNTPLAHPRLLLVRVLDWIPGAPVEPVLGYVVRASLVGMGLVATFHKAAVLDLTLAILIALYVGYHHRRMRLKRRKVYSGDIKQDCRSLRLKWTLKKLFKNLGRVTVRVLRYLARWTTAKISRLVANATPVKGSVKRAPVSFGGPAAFRRKLPLAPPHEPAPGRETGEGGTNA